MSACFFTGHNRLPIGEERELLLSQLDEKITKLYNKGCEVFVADVIFEFNAFAARRVIELKKQGLPIALKIVMPYKNYERHKNRRMLSGHEQILEASDEIIYAAATSRSYWYYALENMVLQISDYCIAYITWSDYKVLSMLKRADEMKIKIEVLNMVFDERTGEYL